MMPRVPFKNKVTIDKQADMDLISPGILNEKCYKKDEDLMDSKLFDDDDLLD